MNRKFATAFMLVPALLMLLLVAACNKIEYTQIKEPAYLRVFNDLNYTQNMDNKNNKYPSLCMIINPVFDAKGIPTGGQIVGDFLDKREPYAPPYPSHAGNSSSVQNPEYPGKEPVLVGPILNGFDLSSWAQVPSGKLRVVFYYRPYNSAPFFSLDESLKHDLLADTTIDLSTKEVYTLHVLQKDFITKKTGLLLRQENFYKLSLSDSLVYVNFYNYSAKGFAEADYSLKPQNVSLASFRSGIKDRMNVFLTLYDGQTNPTSAPIVTGYNGNYLCSINRNTDSGEVSPYNQFPLWASAGTDGIKTDVWQRFEFLVPGLDIVSNPYSKTNIGTSQTYANYASVNCLLNGKVTIGGNFYLSNGVFLPNLLVSLHSGVNNPQTFATVNTIEVVNSNIYLTTIQRKYPVPIYK
ncbi:hypothetical protein [Mucilaginibacter celer]|uniref:DUF4270 domain-containing protein n=1 Tax=Mucilaginibacter celer TaxID=2305508 RepID=A0A494VSC9_9SPHI|nr:hypothetical protein [Mucilaginibacter celer]AYL93842.1 hypothetical protein HYN43_000375 [Mucilaginibacter celer]